MPSDSARDANAEGGDFVGYIVDIDPDSERIAERV